MTQDKHSWIDHIGWLVGVLGIIFAVIGLVYAYQANQLAQDALTEADEANKYAQEANTLSQQSNDLTSQANEIARLDETVRQVVLWKSRLAWDIERCWYIESDSAYRFIPFCDIERTREILTELSNYGYDVLLSNYYGPVRYIAYLTGGGQREMRWSCDLLFYTFGEMAHANDTMEMSFRYDEHLETIKICLNDVHNEALYDFYGALLKR